MQQYSFWKGLFLQYLLVHVIVRPELNNLTESLAQKRLCMLKRLAPFVVIVGVKNFVTS